MEEFNLWGIKHDPGKTFHPCNGLEGSAFMDHFCEKCLFDEEKDCEILTATMLFMPDESEYPKEWVYNENGNPTCTAFKQLLNEGK